MSTKEKSLNFIEQIIEEDLKNGLPTEKLHFRFPPEPNGYLHVGHASFISNSMRSIIRCTTVSNKLERLSISSFTI